MRALHTRQRGVSLIEALVALIVMSFGMLAVLGVQATLRLNADSARQRSEAVRIAQETIEARRGFAKLDSGAAAKFIDIDSVATENVVSANANTTFRRTQTVQIPADPLVPDPRIRTLNVQVEWVDRANVTQRVELSTAVFGVEPELAGSLGIPADRTLIRNPGGRNPVIPIDATDLGDGTSEFTPPGAPAGISWVFNNRSGFITTICTAPGVCTAINARLLAGFIRFAVSPTVPPSSFNAASPTDLIPAGTLFGVAVLNTSPLASAPVCYVRPTGGNAVPYHCALEVINTRGPGAPLYAWSGRSELTLAVTTPPAPLNTAIATDPASADGDEFKVCRYTPYNDDRTVVSGTITNDEHPRDYHEVTRSLTGQNFLVVRAGDGTTPFACPSGPGPLPFVNANTRLHQPPPP